MFGEIQKETVSEPSFAPYDRLMSTPSARKTVPAHLKRSTDQLLTTIIASWISAEPTSEQKKYVTKLSTKLTGIINELWGNGSGNPRFVVDIFGSVSWGGETGKGDIDMVIRDEDLPQGCKSTNDMAD